MISAICFASELVRFTPSRESASVRRIILLYSRVRCVFAFELDISVTWLCLGRSQVCQLKQSVRVISTTFQMEVHARLNSACTPWKWNLTFHFSMDKTAENQVKMVLVSIGDI